MDQNSGNRLEDAGAAREARLREIAPGTWAIVDERSGEAVGGQAGRQELLIPWEDAAAQRAAIAAGYTREGVRRGDPELLVWSRLPGDPEGPTPRLLPDLPDGLLTDGVVTLRPLGGEDIDFYTELHSVPDVVATSVPPEVRSAEEIRRRCTRSGAHWLAGHRADMVILDAATGARAGQIDLYYQEPPTGQAMIGYSMLPAYRKRGFTSRATQLVALWAFAETGIARLIAGTLPTNVGSQRVLERAGFTREAYLRSRLPGPDGTRTDDLQYVLLAGDLLAQVSGEDGTSHA